MDVVVAAEVLRRVHRTRQVVSLVSQLIIRGYDEEALHAETCRHLVTFGGYLMAWVGLVEEKPERIVRPVAHAGIEPNFLHSLKITWSNDLARRSPTSRAITEQRPQVARRIPTEPSAPASHPDAKLFGFTATCALPLNFNGFGGGALTVHSAEPDAFGPEEVSLLRELANDLAAGIIGLREKARRKALEERLAAVVDAAEDAIIGADLGGVVTDWNQGAVHLFGYSKEEAIGRVISEFLVPAEGREEEQRIRGALSRGERLQRFEATRLCKDGHIIRTSMTASPIFAGNRAPIGSTSIEHDITEARRAENAGRSKLLEDTEVTRLKSLENVRKIFLSEASHELNTPLTPIRIHVEALRDGPDVTRKQREHLVVIERNVLRLCNLVKDMLEASRLETGRFRLELADVAVALAIADAVQGLTESATKAGITLRTGEVVPMAVRADRNRLGQVLYNLLTNAIGFTPRGGCVTVSAALEEGWAVVRVSDTGLGMTPEQVERLFQPFSRPHEGNESSPKGTGLGLFISKGIIEQHGARIWAESLGPGRGSCFAFSLPLADPPVTDGDGVTKAGIDSSALRPALTPP